MPATNSSDGKRPTPALPGVDVGATGILRVPLPVKLIGANLLIAVLAWGALFVGPRDSERLLVSLGVGLLAGVLANLALVTLALRPIRDLQRTVWHIWHGDPAARVPTSPIGDPKLDQVGVTVNALLDHLEQDRGRLHALATEVIRAEDRERARIGRELHDSIAQQLAALTYQMTAMETDCENPMVAARLRALRVQTGQVLDEVDMLSHTVHPRVLNDLGLLAGLRHLARTVGGASHQIEVLVTSGSESDFRGLGMETGAVLYRVAQEALQNALRHAKASRIRIIIGAEDSDVTMRVEDDGVGFELGEAQARRPGMGLFTMRERVGLVRGECVVDTAPGKGTTVRVRIPIERGSFKPVPELVQ